MGKNDNTIDKILSVAINLFNSVIIDGDVRFLINLNSLINLINQKVGVIKRVFLELDVSNGMKVKITMTAVVVIQHHLMQARKTNTPLTYMSNGNN